MTTYVFKVPDRDLEALVTVYDDGRAELAFRPGFGSWGPPIEAREATLGDLRGSPEQFDQALTDAAETGIREGWL